MHNYLRPTFSAEQKRINSRHYTQKITGTKNSTHLKKLMANGIKFTFKNYCADNGQQVRIATPHPDMQTRIDNKYILQTDKVCRSLNGVENLGVGKRNPWEWEPHTSSTTDELLDMAESCKGQFMGIIRSSLVGSAQANFGPDDSYVCKSKSSLERKTEDISKKMLAGGSVSSLEEGKRKFISTCNDSLRGTVTVKNSDELRGTIEGLVKSFEEQGMEVSVSNKWENGGYPDGYVGVHMVIKMKNSVGKTILTELQVHLEDFTTPEFKKVAHSCYEDSRKSGSLNTQIRDANLATKALYFTSLN